MFYRVIHLFIGVLFWSLFALSAYGDVWYAEVRTGSRVKVAPAADKSYAGNFSLPESVLFYREPDRNTYRPTEKEIFTRYLSIELCIDALKNHAESPLPVKLFIKDKDGIFFQSVETFYLRPGQWQTLTLELTGSARALEGVGHEWEWCDLAASRIFNVGFKLFSDDTFSGTVRWKEPRFHSPRPAVPLKVVDWHMPDKVRQNEQLISSFSLSREYFNNFDPAEIMVDFEVKATSGTAPGRIFPAFYNLNYRRQMDYTREKFLPFGRPFWELRYLPKKPGKYLIRLLVKDRQDSIVTQWRNFEVVPGQAPGTVGISRRNPYYLEFDNGQSFWPVGLNIHTNIDLRCERVFRLGHRPDRGLADYEDYFRSAATHLINSVEIWMANWSFAIEGDVNLNGMFGMGSYNLANAAKLDMLLEQARKNNIYIHLVLDNHGKVSSHVDPEWAVNPMNSKHPSARANGAFLPSAGNFWTDATARKFYDRRNRYLAARYGADPAIWGIELWSEGNLTDSFIERYKDRKVLNWYDESSRKWQSMDSAGHLITTHLSGNYDDTKQFIEIFKLDSIHYIVGDAYRNPQARIDHFLATGDKAVKKTSIRKPYIITEYGGDSGGCPPANMLADIHGGLWASFFAGYAGSPLLWWHDFVHVNNHYVHHQGLARFIADIRRDDPALKQHSNIVISDPKLKAAVINNAKELYAWIYEASAMQEYPFARPKSVWKNIRLQLKNLQSLQAGVYKVVYFNTISNAVLAVQEVEYSPGELVLKLPGFVIDTALKMRFVRPLPQKGSAK